MRPDGRQLWLEETAKGEFDATGRLLQIKGLTRDITEQKSAELTLAERNAQLGLAGQAARVGSYAYDVEKGSMQVSEGYAAIYGLPEGPNEKTISEWFARVHPEDRTREKTLRNQIFAEKRNKSTIEYRMD